MDFFLLVRICINVNISAVRQSFIHITSGRNFFRYKFYFGSWPVSVSMIEMKEIVEFRFLPMIINDLGAKFPEQSSRIAIESSSPNDDEGLSQCAPPDTRRKRAGTFAREEREKKSEKLSHMCRIVPTWCIICKQRGKRIVKFFFESHFEKHGSMLKLVREKESR